MCETDLCNGNITIPDNDNDDDGNGNDNKDINNNNGAPSPKLSNSGAATLNHRQPLCLLNYFIMIVVFALVLP